ncbi:unnamed protein product [Urochloa decumbens]|uniref:WPP domain-containing protein n=1 Tax=Urochloa decumbens TaxID=240449 RepID=A0ABC9A1J9_9POAL
MLIRGAPPLGGCLKLLDFHMDSTPEDSQSRTPPPVKLWPPGNWTRKELIDSLEKELSTEPFDDSHGLLSREEAHKNAKRIEKACFAIADKHSKEHDDYGISVMSLYTDNSLKMRSELQKTIPRGNTAFEGLAERLLLHGAFSNRCTRDTPSLEEFKTKPLLCPLTGLGRSYKRICLNKSFGTTDGTSAAPICLKGPALRDNLVSVDAGVALSETTGKLTYPISRYRSNLNLESMGTTTIEPAPLSELLTPRNEITDKASRASGKCLTESKLPEKLSETENKLDGDGALIAAKTSKQSHEDQEELQVSTDILRRVGAWFLKHAATGEPGFVLPSIIGNVIRKEGVDELKKILKDDTDLLAMLGFVAENEPEEEARANDREEVDAGGDVVTKNPRCVN